MATALKLKNDINKLKAALRSKATPKSFIPKLKSQLDKAEADYESVKAGKKSAPKAGKQVKSTMDKLKAIIKKKKYGAYRAQGVDLKKDADRPALPTGKRISKNGNTYYEYRANRIDVKQPPKRYPKLQDGGYMADGGRVLVGRFDEQQLRNKEDKKAVEKAQKETGLKYVDTKFVKKGGKMMMEVYLIPNEEYYKSSKFADGGLLKEDDFVWNEVGKKLVVDKVTDTEYFLKGFMQPSTSPFSKNKVDTYIKLGKWSLKPKMADGGVIYLESVGTYFRPSDLATSSEKSFSNEGEIVDLADIDNEEWFNALSEKDRATIEKYKASGGYMAKGGRVDDFSDKIQEGDIVWDSNNKRYGVVLNTYDYKYGEIRLDSDGNQPIEDLYKLGSEGDKGTKEKLKEALLAHKRLMTEYPDRYDKVNYAKGGYMADGGMTPLDVSNQIYDITVRIAELGDINTEAAYEETKNLMKMRAALQARALHLQDMEMAKGGYMAHGGVAEKSKLYYHKTSGGAEYLCSEKVRGTKDEGSLNSTICVRIDGAKNNGGELIIGAWGLATTESRKEKIKLYYHKTSGGAEYLCSSKVKGTKDEGSFDSKYIVRIDNAKNIGGELLIKMASGGYMADGGDLSSIKKKYEENEDENAHSENVVLLAKHFGTKEDLAKAKEILALHEKEGSLSSENGKKRQELHLKLIGKAKAEMGKQGIEFAKGGKTKDKKAVVVSFNPMTRVIVSSKDSEEKIVEKAREKMRDDLSDYLSVENLDEIKDDSEMPYNEKDDYAKGGELHRSKDSEYKYGGYMAMGGALSHGLKEGDHIMVVKGNILGIKNEETGEFATLDISTGERNDAPHLKESLGLMKYYSRNKE
jgi:hypothetical protein